METPAGLLDLGASRYISLTTFRRSGEAVSTPVWVARDGDALVVMTTLGSGKAKRIRNDPHVRVAACSASGKVAPGAPRFDASAEVLGSVEAEHQRFGLLRAKYGVQLRLFFVIEHTVQRLRRKPPEEWVVIRLTPRA
ncbi:hypothetical protein CLV35_2358 [Motilibacter peucedani]|uniref:Pyridoxamine 5'-phosphate oxidase N-terminal domain-containing protein n=1 Tax=Motilibacter peucedani TaxID=598650 RepID=A0A420XNV1_9ACTN|nr:PPOX class F420-dependent oxidoreductase [Motilibacter peucedani]RKS73864.1 hypothetical protein CLV35_2358 [Motilibacter peucedani]